MRKAAACLGTIAFALAAGMGTMALYACGDDSSKSGASEGPPAGPGENPTIPPALQEALSLVAGNTTTYVDEPAIVGARASTVGVTYHWTLDAKPAASKRDTSALQHPEPSSAKLVPDVSGVYTLTVTVKGFNSEASRGVTVEAKDAPIFYLSEVKIANGSYMRVAHAVRPDDTALTCPFYDVMSDSDDADAGGPGPKDGGPVTLKATPAECTEHIAATNTDAWEARAGVRSRVAFVLPGFERRASQPGSGAMDPVLVATTTGSVCQGEETTERFDLDRAVRGVELLQPQFSPDGAHIAYLAKQAGSLPSMSKTELKVVGSEGVPKAATVASIVFGNYEVRPQWLDSKRIAWVGAKEAGTWAVRVVSLDEGAPQQIYCSGPDAASTVVQVGWLSEDTFLATEKGANAPALIRYQKVGDQCVKTGVIATDAGDFAISADRQNLAFLKSVSGKIPTLHTLALNQPNAVPVEVSASPSAYGPRWIANGNAITWSLGEDIVVEAGVTVTQPTKIAKIDIATKTQTEAAVAEPGSTLYGLGNGASTKLTTCKTSQHSMPISPAPPDP